MRLLLTIALLTLALSPGLTACVDRGTPGQLTDPPDAPDPDDTQPADTQPADPDASTGTPEWAQQAYIKASNTDGLDFFGTSVSLSADGTTLAVGAEDEDSSATGIDGTQDDESATASGAVYIFVRSGTTWVQQAYIKASHNGHQFFGNSVSLSDDGDTLAVGAPEESSSGGTYSCTGSA